MDEALEQMGVRGYIPNPPGFDVYGGLRFGHGPFYGGVRLADAPQQNEGAEMVAGLGKTVVWGSLIAFGVWFFLLRK